MSTISFRLRVLVARIERRLRSALSRTPTVYVGERVQEYRTYWAQGAEIVGARLTDLLPGVWEVERGGTRTRIANYVTQCDDPVTLQLAGDKPYGYALAQAAGVPVPPYRVVTPETIGGALEFLGEVGGPLVVKPAAGSSSGLGISMGIRSPGQLRAALALASLFDARILVERMVVGESYRVLYLAGRAIHAVRRRGVGSRPHEGVTRELRTVYDESVLGLCGEELLEEGAAIVRGLGSEFAGVDVITTNPAMSLRESGGAFIEINTTPGIHHHYITDADRRPMPVAAQVLEYLLARTRAS